MIILSARQQWLLSNPDAEKFYCVQIKDLKLTSYHRDLNLADGIYVASDLLANIAAPEATSSVDRSLYEVILHDNENALADLYFQNLIGSKMDVRLGFVDPDTDAPDVAELFTLYSGIVQGKDTNYDMSIEGGATTKIIGSNLMAALDAVNSFYASKEYLRDLDATDTAFDQIYEGSQSLSLLWGKK